MDYGFFDQWRKNEKKKQVFSGTQRSVLARGERVGVRVRVSVRVRVRVRR
jgi:hypothetical protein